jgi:hypothetical protein
MYGRSEQSLALLDIFSPVMDILVSKDFSDLPIAQWRLILSHFSRDLRPRTFLCQKFFGRHSPNCNGVIRRVKYLESNPALLDCQVTNLTKVSGIDITPCVSLSRRRIAEIGWEIPLVFVRLYYVSDAECIDIISEASGKSSSSLLATDLRQGIPRPMSDTSRDQKRETDSRIFWINIIVFFQWERVIIRISLSEAYAVSGL